MGRKSKVKEEYYIMRDGDTASVVDYDGPYDTTEEAEEVITQYVENVMESNGTNSEEVGSNYQILKVVKRLIAVVPTVKLVESH